MHRKKGGGRTQPAWPVQNRQVNGRSSATDRHSGDYPGDKRQQELWPWIQFRDGPGRRRKTTSFKQR